MNHDDNDPLAQLEAAVRAEDPVFAKGMARSMPGPPREYRRAAWKGTLCRFAAALAVLVAVQIRARPLLCGMLLALALSLAVVDRYAARPPDLDGPGRPEDGSTHD